MTGLCVTSVFFARGPPQSIGKLPCFCRARPPDVVDGPPVGSTTNVCQVCHSSREPSDWQDDPEEYHQKHTDKRIDCGACHMQANLQDDRVPMPDIDDSVRALVDRSGTNECALCHEGGASPSGGDTIQEVHRRHAARDYQWCYNCHEPSDLRPLGLEPPVTEPAESCALCHDDEDYDDEFPFDVHEEHAKRNKCYVCHQATSSCSPQPGEAPEAPPTSTETARSASPT